MAEQADRLMVAMIMPEMAIGETFEQWPLHMTVMSWFDLPHHAWPDFDEGMHDVVLETKPHPVVGGPESHFDTANGPVQVRRLDTYSHLRYMMNGFFVHSMIYQLVRQYGELDDETYMGVDWQPHVSSQPGAKLHEGEELKYSGLTVVQKNHVSRAKLVRALYRWGEFS